MSPARSAASSRVGRGRGTWPFLQVLGSTLALKQINSRTYSRSAEQGTSSSFGNPGLAGLKAFNECTRPMKALQMEYLDGAGVVIDWSDPYALYSHRAWITQCPKELDFPNDNW